jgi:hypothetical protein
MAFVPGLSKKQVEKVILNYAEIAPETMQLLDDLSAQINDPNDPAAALIDRMVVVEADVDSLESSVSSLNSTVSGKQDAVAGISSAEIGTLDGIQSSIQGQLDSKAPLSSPTISNPTFTGTVTLPNASIANNKLQNSSISINGTSIPLGGNATVVGTALPNQSNNAGKALFTSGSSLSWETVDVSNLTDPTISITVGEPTMVSSVTGVEIGANLNPGETSYLELSDFASSEWFYSLGANIDNGYYYIQLTSEWPAGPSFLTLKILSLNTAYAYPRLYVEYSDGQYTAQSGWAVDLYLLDDSPKVISPTELSYLDGLTGNVESRLSNLTNPTISIDLSGVADVKTSGFGPAAGGEATSYVIYPEDPGYSESLAMATYFGATEGHDPVSALINTTGITSGGWISGTTSPTIENFFGNINIQWSTIAFDSEPTFDNPKFNYVDEPVSISPAELSYLNGLTGNVESRLTFDAVKLNQNYADSVVMQLSKEKVIYGDTQPVGESYALTVSLYNDTGADPGNDTSFSLNSSMTVGQAVTFVLIQKNGSTGVYIDEVQAPKWGANSTVNLMWQGGSAPTAPNLNATDIYTFTVLKTANDVFDVFADVAKFA